MHTYIIIMVPTRYTPTPMPSSNSVSIPWEKVKCFSSENRVYLSWELEWWASWKLDTIKWKRKQLERTGSLTHCSHLNSNHDFISYTMHVWLWLQQPASFSSFYYLLSTCRWVEFSCSEKNEYHLHHFVIFKWRLTMRKWLDLRLWRVRPPSQWPSSWTPCLSL